MCRQSGGSEVDGNLVEGVSKSASGSFVGVSIGVSIGENIFRASGAAAGRKGGALVGSLNSCSMSENWIAAIVDVMVRLSVEKRDIIVGCEVGRD